jgi:hypothetical protein
MRKKYVMLKVKVKLSRYRPEEALGGSGRLRLRIFMTFGTVKVVGRYPYAQATFTPRSFPVAHFQRLSRPQGTWFHR